jgi:endonuclease/exonuclease/phosphatase family metal-dependent hydrolase
MKKILCGILLFGMLLSLFTACGADKKDKNEAPDTDAGTNETPGDENGNENQTPGSETIGEEGSESVYEDTDPISLNIGSYNIANGKVVGHNFAKLAKDILGAKLDIVGFQEVDQFCNRSGNVDTMKTLSELTGYKYYYFSKAINIGGDPAKYGQDGEYGTGILSKYPITFEETTQLASGGYEQRVLGHAVIQVEDAEVHFFNAHLTYNTLNVRKAQMEAIEEKVWEYDYCLLTGDFNIEALEEFATIGSLTGVSNEDNPLHSYWKEETPPWPTECLDNIMYSSYFKLLDCGVVNDRKHSDHYMIWAEFEVK